MTGVYLCDDVRTPTARFGGALRQVRPDDPAAMPLRALIARNSGADRGAVDAGTLGCPDQALRATRRAVRRCARPGGRPARLRSAG